MSDPIIINLTVHTDPTNGDVFIHASAETWKALKRFLENNPQVIEVNDAELYIVQIGRLSRNESLPAEEATG